MINFSDVFAAFIFLLIGSGAVLAGLQTIKKNTLASSWPTTQGTIIDSTLERYSKRNDEGNMRAYYRPLITYQYEVEGEEFTCNQVRVTGFSSSTMRSHEEKKLEKFPVGGQVTVHFDPSNPYDALLEIKKGKINLALILGVAMLGGFLYFAYRIAMGFGG